MKAFKLFGCLVLLCVIICGCAALGKVAVPESDGNTKTVQGEVPDNSGGGDNPLNLAAGEEGKKEEGSVEVAPIYSEGLRFRSNGDGTCALSGIGECTASCLLIPPTSPAGDTVTEILPFALSGSLIGAVEIPTTVKTLSAASFAGCKRLSLLRVAAGNECFSESDGALYNAAGTVLLYCPPGHAGELTLRPTLRQICAGAFADCAGLRTIAFPGSTSEWHGIVVGDENDPLYAAVLRFGK